MNIFTEILANEEITTYQILEQAAFQPRLRDFILSLYRSKNDYRLYNLKQMDSTNLKYSFYVLSYIFPSEDFHKKILQLQEINNDETLFRGQKDQKLESLLEEWQ